MREFNTIRTEYFDVQQKNREIRFFAKLIYIVSLVICWVAAFTLDGYSVAYFLIPIAFTVLYVHDKRFSVEPEKDSLVWKYENEVTNFSEVGNEAVYKKYRQEIKELEFRNKRAWWLVNYMAACLLFQIIFMVVGYGLQNS